MVTRRSLLLLPLQVLATLALVEGGFHDGITGSSLRWGDPQNAHTQQWSRRAQHEQRHQQSRNLQAFTGSTSAKESCEAAKAKEESDIAPGGGTSKCECAMAQLDDRYGEFVDVEDQPLVFELTCIDQRCSYCSKDGSTCDRFSYGALFEEVKIREGLQISDAVVQVGYFETNQYIVGRPEAVTYTEYTDPANPGAHACSMAIDGLQCAVCEYVNCIGGNLDPSGLEIAAADGATATTTGMDVYYGLNVVCSNILITDGADGWVPASDFETCDQAQIEAIGESQGVFEMYDPDYGQCYTSAMGCDRDKVELEQSGYYECHCLDMGGTLGVSPFLEHFRLECSSTTGGAQSNIFTDKEVCGTVQKDTLERTYSSYVGETNTRTIELESGSTLVIDEFDCLLTRGYSEGCDSCNAYVDGVKCSSCEMLACESTDANGETLKAPVVQCGNVSDEIPQDKEINLCRPATAKGTPFEAFSECGFGESSKVDVVLPEKEEPSYPSPISLLACQEFQSEFSLRTNNFVDSQALNCECRTIHEDWSIDSGTLFECTSNGGACGTSHGGSVCNADYETDEASETGQCFREELVQGFLPDGSKTPLTRTTTYTHGSTTQGTSLVGKTLVLTEYGNGDSGCQLLVDGELCDSCQLEHCGETMGVRPLVDCSNISDVADEDAASLKLDTCQAFGSYGEGFLLRLTAGALRSETLPLAPHQDFESCRDVSDQPKSVDHSLPKRCHQAQPIVLPFQQDNPVAIPLKKDVTNPNSMFAFVSLVSSTKGLPIANNELKKVQTTCEAEQDENDEDTAPASPGLWYSLEGIDKGVHASVCREATDFDARISIYEGSCDAMDCVASTPLEASNFESSCDVHWYAEQGVTYYIRVHGTEESPKGTFNLFLETLEDDTTLTCYDETAEDFDPACLSCSKERAKRIQQFSTNNEKDPAEIDCQCVQNSGTGGYHLSCVDLSCLKCNPRQDVCGFDTYEQEIKHTGEFSFGSYSSFYFMNMAEGTQASEIMALENSECMEIQDPYQQCILAKEDVMARENVGDATDAPFFCECRQVTPEGEHLLICSPYNSYEYCSSDEEDGGVCADTILFGQSITEFGSVFSEFRNYVLTPEETDLVSEETSIVIERFYDMCYVTVNNETCTSCEIVETCVDNDRDEDILNIASADSGLAVFTDLSIDCSNIIPDVAATFECGSATSNPKNLLSILGESVLVPKEGVAKNLDQTIPPDAFGPTMPPVTRPTVPPVDPPSLGTVDIDAGDSTAVEVEDEDVAVDPVDQTNSSEEEPPDSSSTGLAEGRTMAYLGATMVGLASLFLLL